MHLIRTLLLFFGILFSWSAIARDFSPIPTASRMTDVDKAEVPFNLTTLKHNWKQRIAAMRAQGVMPIIDIESNLGEDLDMQSFAHRMDDEGVALIAFSGVAKGRGWSDAARYAVAADPWRYVPTGDGGLPPDWKRDPMRFAQTTKERIAIDGYPLMGEYEFRHYPSPDQIERGNLARDEDFPIDSPAGHALFRFSAESGIPFQIHLEIEDALLPPLEKMLAQYPKAKVIWCHLAQMRYQDRNTIYGPDYVRKLIKQYPNLYFDLFSGPPDHVYPSSREYPGKYWDRSTRKLKQEWAKLIADYPWRFMTALDLNPFIMRSFSNKVGMQRAVLDSLPESVREIVAYRATWKLLFNEDL
ncbi:amidohydrolase [Herbaspirillum sp. ST 5-3]|uniref:amidohydrolase family protein n=1 Tax=Oxalobacteraceae TaxID=75682 RepID=UPI0010A2B203|nr:amidohydrolase [Herbaspirillum sp. ST 5-3]